MGLEVVGAVFGVVLAGVGLAVVGLGAGVVAGAVVAGAVVAGASVVGATSTPAAIRGAVVGVDEARSSFFFPPPNTAPIAPKPQIVLWLGHDSSSSRARVPRAPESTKRCAGGILLGQSPELMGQMARDRLFSSTFARRPHDPRWVERPI